MEPAKRKRRSRARGLAETYIHVAVSPGSLSKEEALAYLKKNAGVWAELQFKQPVEVLIAVEEGSLILRILVGGLAIANMVTLYGGLRAGIDYVVKDSRAFSDTAIEHFIEDEHISPEAIIRAERRLGVPGKIQRFFKSLDTIDSVEYSHVDRQQLTQDLQQEFLSILELLDTPEDQQLFLDETPSSIKEGLPQSIVGQLPAFQTPGSLTSPQNKQQVGYSPYFPYLPEPRLPSPNRNAITHVYIRQEDDE